MALSDNPFVVLSYVGGPALLTNATSVFILSTSNRFARAIDRARALSAMPQAQRQGFADELVIVHARVAHMARAMACLYVALTCFALGTAISIGGAAVAEFSSSKVQVFAFAAAGIAGAVGFAAFVGGAAMLVLESRAAMKAVLREADAALASLKK
ncbi:MAG TPA: DUF2721 domain-containing protein [Rhizomicrobium sp.]|jgi:hypothetical protein